MPSQLRHDDTTTTRARSLRIGTRTVERSYSPLGRTFRRRSKRHAPAASSSSSELFGRRTESVAQYLHQSFRCSHQTDSPHDDNSHTTRRFAATPVVLLRRNWDNDWRRHHRARCSPTGCSAALDALHDGLFVSGFASRRFCRGDCRRHQSATAVPDLPGRGVARALGWYAQSTPNCSTVVISACTGSSFNPWLHRMVSLRCSTDPFRVIVTTRTCCAILSKLLAQLEELFPEGEDFYSLYRDPAYPQSRLVFGGFRYAPPNSPESKWNKRMHVQCPRVRRMVVRWHSQQVVLPRLPFKYASLQDPGGAVLPGWGLPYKHPQRTPLKRETGVYFKCATPDQGMLTLHQHLAEVNVPLDEA